MKLRNLEMHNKSNFVEMLRLGSHWRVVIMLNGVKKVTFHRLWLVAKVKYLIGINSLREFVNFES